MTFPNSAAATLVCPKCTAEMRSYERNGVMVDRCTECRGIFLDRGELERLMDVEQPPERPMASMGRGDDRDYDDDDDDRYEDRDDDRDRWRELPDRRGRPAYSQRPDQRKRRGFLSDLLEFG
jgi:hypothetical protein